MSTKTVNLVGTSAPLVSGKFLAGCQVPSDVECNGGVAAVSAYTRYHSKDEPLFVCPTLDTKQQFVQAHPMGWNINHAVLHGHFGWPVATSKPSLLSKDEEVDHELSGLQSPDMPLLLSNVAVPPSNSWHPYTELVHFDKETKIALIILEEEAATLSWPKAESALGALDFVAAENERTKCEEDIDLPEDLQVQKETSSPSVAPSSIPSSMPTQAPSELDVVEQLNKALAGNLSQMQQEQRNRQRSSTKRPSGCWLPVIFVQDSNADSFQSLVSVVSDRKTPPALIFDLEGKYEAYSKPRKNSRGVWIVSHKLTDDTYLHCRLRIDTVTNQVSELDLVTGDLNELSSELKDEHFISDMKYLRSLADEALRNDPIVGISNYMPGTQRGECLSGECELGNLVADSLRWKAYADVAFVPSQTLAGPGWPFGDVRVSDIWNSIPKATSMCTGTMSGLSLFKVIDYTFSGGENIERMLQVSGIRVVYNTQSQDSSKIVTVQVWDYDAREYREINRLRLYKFAAEGSLCASNGPYASLFGEDFVISGEKAGIIDDINLVQNVVGDYLKTGTTYYVPELDGRLTNDIEATGSLGDSFRTEGKCPSDTYWSLEEQTCFPCPSKESHVTFSDEILALTTTRDKNLAQGRVVLVNRELHTFMLVAGDLPSWVEITGSSTNTTTTTGSFATDTPFRISSGERIALDLTVNTSSVGIGPHRSAVTFSVTDHEKLPGCSADSRIASFDILVDVLPPEKLMHLGSNTLYGYLIMGAILCFSAGFGLWSFLNRESRGYGDLGDKTVKPLQPIYLVAICFGVAFMAFTIIPLSFDDDESLYSTSGDKFCLMTPWLLSLGIIITFSALLSKFWAVKRVSLTPNNREIAVSTVDLLKPFSFLIVVNFGMLGFMLMEPPRWVREADNEEGWRIYGSCKYTDLSSSLLFGSSIVHLLTLLYTCFEAYRVNAVSEHSKAVKPDGIAIYVWLQIVIIALPIWWVLDQSEIITRYYFEVGVVGTLSLSMLLCIFVPVVTKKLDNEQASKNNSKRNKVTPDTPEGHDDNESFLGFLGFAGGSRQGGPRTPEIPDEESLQQEEQNRCLADRFCY